MPFVLFGLCLPSLVLANEPRLGTVTPFRRIRLEPDRSAVRESRAEQDLLAAIPLLVFTVEEEFPEDMIRARAVALARAIVYFANQMPVPPDNDWKRTQQIRSAARLVKDELDRRLRTARAPRRIGSKIKALLSETMVNAQKENRVLAKFVGNKVDVRRTDRVLREVARTLPLTCEHELYKAPL